MVAFLVGLQGAFTKFQCYICLLDMRNTALHYKKCSWPPRASCENGTYNMKQPLVDAAKILMPPLNNKLGLIKQFVKQVDAEGER